MHTTTTKKLSPISPHNQAADFASYDKHRFNVPNVCMCVFGRLCSSVNGIDNFHAFATVWVYVLAESRLQTPDTSKKI